MKNKIAIILFCIFSVIFNDTLYERSLIKDFFGANVTRIINQTSLYIWVLAILFLLINNWQFIKDKLKTTEEKRIASIRSILITVYPVMIGVSLLSWFIFKDSSNTIFGQNSGNILLGVLAIFTVSFIYLLLRFFLRKKY